MRTDVLGKNARRIRHDEDMTQADVARRANISVLTYSRIEAGRSMPRMGTLYAIAKALRVGVHDLLAPVNELSSVRFRAKKKLKKRDSILAKAATWLHDFNYLLNTLDAEATFTLSQVPQEVAAIPEVKRPIEAARVVRGHMGLDQKEPIHDITGLLASNGIKVLAYPLNSDAFFGLSIGERDGGPAIVVNVWDRLPVERWIFSAAHELGHLMLHLEAFDAGIAEEDPRQEREADLFASHLLMPQSGFEREWEETYGLSFWSRVLKVKRIYHVSDKTVIYRLLDSRVVGKDIWAKRNLFVKATNKNIVNLSKFEPERLRNYDFVTDWLDRLVRLAVEQEAITVNRAGDILDIPLEQMRERTASWVEEGRAERH
jgi:Zn-dependent peptidase ImmA (M78 family)/DNA-binding XRE family transcriptional regulator